MKCDVCGNPATIEEVTKIGQSYVYKHLCEGCAASQGVFENPTAHVSASEVKAAIAAVAIRASQPASSCDGCGLSFAQFRETGRLGCPRCYDAFEDKLGPLIARAHEGGTHHVGKVPKRLLESATGNSAESGPPSRYREAIDRLMGEAHQREEKLQSLKRQLSAAIRGERYEHAAMIRDEIDRLMLIDRPSIGPAPEGGRDG